MSTTDLVIDPRSAIVVARKGLLGEAFCAALIHLTAEAPVDRPRYVLTPALTDPVALGTLLGQGHVSLDMWASTTLVLLGGYYLHNKALPALDALAARFARVICLCKADDVLERGESPSALTLITEPMCAWTARHVRGLEVTRYALALDLIKSLDDMDYAHPDERAKNIHYGVPCAEGADDVAKFVGLLHNERTIDSIVAHGIAKRASTAFVCQRRADDAVCIPLRLPEHVIVSKETAYDRSQSEFVVVNVLVGSGDTPIAESADAVAEKSPSGLGMLVRYNPARGITQITVCAHERSAVSAARVAAFLCKVAGGSGGGSVYLGGGSVPQCFLPWVESQRLAVGWH